MATKLTLSLNDQTIKRAKAWAKMHHAGMFKGYDEKLSYKELIHKYGRLQVVTPDECLLHKAKL